MSTNIYSLSTNERLQEKNDLTLSLGRQSPVLACNCNESSETDRNYCQLQLHDYGVAQETYYTRCHPSIDIKNNKKKLVKKTWGLHCILTPDIIVTELLSLAVVFGNNLQYTPRGLHFHIIAKTTVENSHHGGR